MDNKNMDLIKMWSNLIAANAIYRNINSEGVCALPTTYFMQGVHLFASENALNCDVSEATISDDESDASEVEVEPDNERYSQDDVSLADSSKSDDQRSTTPSSTVLHSRRRIQRTRYSREEYKCPTCAYTCTIEKAFFKHLRQDCEQATNSEGDPRISCPICGKDRDSEPLLMAHMVKHRCGKHFCCDLCKFRTLQMKKLIQHRRMHTGEKPHLCPYCSYRSARRDNLRSHVRRVHKKENLTCDTFAPRNMILHASSASTPATAHSSNTTVLA